MLQCRTKTIFQTAISCLLMLSLLSIAAFAQFRAAVQGSVSDSNGAVIAGANITLKNNETGRIQQTVANDSGFYRFSNLAPGNYTVTAELSNFKKQVLENIDVGAENTQNIDIALETGGINEVVTVESNNTVALETETGNVQKALTAEEIRALPQQGRDPYELLRLTPGIFGTGARDGGGAAVNLPNTTGPGGSNSSIFQTENQVPISANGQRVSANNFQIDGVSVNSLQYGGAAILTPNQESIKEILVTGTSFSAEDGRNSGAQIKVISQTGTNSFHGSAFFKYNDPKFNAFNKFQGIPDGTAGSPTRVENRDKNFGGSVGGPIVKNRLFFFFSYEGLRNNTNNTYNAFVETSQYRQQVISLRPNSTTAKILQSPGIEPRLVGTLARTCAQTFGSDAMSRCRDVSGGLDLGSITGTRNTYLPLGDGIGSANIGGGFDGIPDVVYGIFANPRKTIGNQYNFRADYNLNTTNTIAVSTFFTPLTTSGADNSSGSRTGSDIIFKPFNYLVTGIYNSNLSPTLINEFRANYTSFKSDQVKASVNTNFGIPRVEVEGLPFDRIRFGAPQGETTPAIFSQTTFEIKDTVTKVIGNHALKFGGEFQREADDNELSGGARPVYSFVGLFNLANDTPIFEGINADLTTGGPANGQRFFRNNDNGFFFQDDWKARQNLTLNLGIRYEYFTPLKEKQNRNTNLVLGTGSNALLNSTVKKVDTLIDGDKNNFAPRFGFAYSPSFSKSGLGFLNRFDNKAVIRGGFGVHYNRIANVVFSNTRGNPPFFGRFSICCGTAPTDFGSPFVGGQIQYVLGTSGAPNSYPRNTVIGGGVNPATNLPFVGAVEIYGANPDVPNARVYKYALEIQAQLPFKLVTSIGYEGNKTSNQIRLVNQNFLYAQTNPNIYAAYFATPDVSGSYNGLNVRLERRFADNFQITANYRFSKSIDTLSYEGPGSVTNQTYPIDNNTERGPSDFDVRHYTTISGVYTLPFFRNRSKVLGKVLGGFEISGIYTRHSGFPFTPKIDANVRSVSSNDRDGFGPIRPVLALSSQPSSNTNANFLRPGGIFPGGGAKYFQTTLNPGDPTYQNNPPGIGRNSYRGPKFSSFDMSLSKKFGLPRFSGLGEDPNIEVKVNFFNVFNNLNLQNFGFFDDGVFVNRAGFGEASGAYAGRTVELQGRFRF